MCVYIQMNWVSLYKFCSKVFTGQDFGLRLASEYSKCYEVSVVVVVGCCCCWLLLLLVVVVVGCCC